MTNDRLSYKEFHRVSLPHIQPENAVLFVTFRTNFTLPPAIANAYHEYKIRLLNEPNLLPLLDNSEIKELRNKKIFAYYDSQLDTYVGEQVNLLQSDTLNIIKKHLFSNNGKLYNLICFNIMSNHIHLLFQCLKRTPDEAYSIAYIMKQIKGATARLINLQLNQNGHFWKKEYYDHYVRDDQEFHNVVRYIVFNPVKAGLIEFPENWPGLWIAPEFIER